MFAFKKEDLADLAGAVKFESPQLEPDPGLCFVPRQMEESELVSWIEGVCLTERDDKQNRLILEYATISGAGKSRWMFHAFKDKTFKTWSGDPDQEEPELKVDVVHTNLMELTAAKIIEC